ncbi:division/cell wall cluster transcriptional repressor MraZ [Flavobacterium sp. PLA-1-15]|uniref:division/cell wall cluster transcriptional repressor MraZ n=1 Tax=Flavobacterium sp. PLA-1-15 TaxID=3380533 RepID=UPI003B820CB6
MNTIIGTYECKVDAKGRLLLPSPLKKQLTASLQEGFVLKRSVFDACLELWPMAEWDLMMLKINKLNRFNKKNNDFIRKFMAGVKVIEIDDLGRLLIPKDLVAFSKITKDVVLSSKVNIVEIWDKDLYEKSIGDDDIDFADLAEEVMGNLNDDENGIS